MYRLTSCPIKDFPLFARRVFHTLRICFLRQSCFQPSAARPRSRLCRLCLKVVKIVELQVVNFLKAWITLKMPSTASAFSRPAEAISPPDTPQPVPSAPRGAAPFLRGYACRYQMPEDAFDGDAPSMLFPPARANGGCMYSLRCRA